MEINKIDYEIGIYDLEGHFIDSTDSWEYLEKEFKLPEVHVRNYLTMNSNYIDIYQLKLRKVNIKSSLPVQIGNVVYSQSSGKKKAPVGKYYKNALVSVYTSINEASELSNIDKGSIHKSISKGCRAKGFKFKYIE